MHVSKSLDISGANSSGSLFFTIFITFSFTGWPLSSNYIHLLAIKKSFHQYLDFVQKQFGIISKFSPCHPSSSCIWLHTVTNTIKSCLKHRPFSEWMWMLLNGYLLFVSRNIFGVLTPICCKLLDAILYFGFVLLWKFHSFSSAFWRRACPLCLWIIPRTSLNLLKCHFELSCSVEFHDDKMW